MRPVVAAGATAAAALLIVLLLQGDEAPYEIVVRDAESLSRTTALLLPPEQTAAGTVTLRWQSVAAADGYQVVFFDVNLSELMSQTTGRDTLLLVNLAGLRTALPGGEREVLWRVHSLSHGDIIGRSQPGALTLP